MRWVNEQTDGGWRYIPYTTIIGRDMSGGTIDMDGTWGSIRAWTHSDSPASVSGTWYFATGEPTSYAGGYGNTDTNRPRYVDYYWAALVAAVERDVAGAALAWWTVVQNVTDLATWRAGFGTEPRWGSVPKVIPPVPGFADGIATGSYDSGTKTLTPAKTSGVVNAASWALVPTMTWVKIAGSNLDAVDAEVTAAVPSWSTAQLNWGGLTQTWSGLAVDTLNSRCWLFGGGHTNGFNNALVRFDAFKMAWAVECMPTDRTTWPGVYTGGSSSTEYNPSIDQYNADIAATTWTAINGSFYDELQDGNPTARHNYQSMVYDSARDKLVMICRRLWEFNLSTGAWDYKRAINDSSAGGGSASVAAYLDNENSVGVYDEVAGEYLTFSTGSFGANSRIRFDLTARTWNTTWANVTWNNVQVYSCRNGRKLVSISPDAGGCRYWVHDLDTKTNDSSAVQATRGGGLTSTSFAWSSTPTGSNPEWSIDYIPRLNRYWIMAYGAANSWALYELDPTTTPYTLSPLTVAGTLPEQPDLMYRRGTYLPGIDALILQGYAGNPIHVCKLA